MSGIGQFKPSKQDRDHGAIQGGDEGLEQNGDGGLFPPLLEGVVQPHGKSVVPGQLVPILHKSVELYTEVVLVGDDEEQLVVVPGLPIRENFMGTSAG